MGFKSDFNSDELFRKVRRDLERKMVELGQVVEAKVKQSINEVSQGKKYKRGEKTHTASKPGDPPNVDSGHLINHIRTTNDFSGNRLSVEVGAYDTNYAYFLEFGTHNIEPRPFLAPIVEKMGELWNEVNE